MNLKLELTIAAKYLRSKQKEGFISVITYFALAGMMLGVATLIIVMSVMKGYEVELIDRIIGINGHLSIEAPENELEENYQNNIHKLLNQDYISFHAPVLTGQAVASSKAGSFLGVSIRGMNHRDFKNKPILRNSLFPDSDNPLASGIVIGSALANNLGVRVGDSIRILTTSFNPTLIGMVPDIKTYKINAIFDVGMYEYNSTTIFMAMSEAKKLLPKTNRSFSIEVLLDNVSKVPELKEYLIDNLQLRNAMISDWQMANQSFANALKVERTVMFFILSLLILIAAFNIISSLIMLVNDKKRNIAIMLTMGADSTMIVRIFILCGIIIGTIGTILGSVLGTAFVIYIDSIKAVLEKITGTQLFDPVVYLLTNLPAVLEIENVIGITLLSIVISLLATIYPAWKASRLTPVEILRYD